LQFGMETSLTETDRSTEKTEKRILIIDDQEENCKMLADVLGPDYKCFYSNDSTRAIQLILDLKPDMVLLDYKMPGLLGVDICEMVRQNGAIKSTPIIFVSGAASSD